MAIALRQSTASQEVPLGIFVDSTDGNTEESGLTIANTDIKIWKTGATTLASKNSGGATYISNGVYYTVLDATDTATIGPLVIFVHVSGALAVRVECVVYDEAVYDSLFGVGIPAVNTTHLKGTALTETQAGTIGSNFSQLFDNAGSAAAGTVIIDNLDAAISSRGSATNLSAVKTQTDKFVFTVANEVNANTRYWAGTALAAPDTAGYPKVTIKSGTGTGELSLTSGVAKANVTQMVGTALVETQAGTIGGNFSFFFDNSGSSVGSQVAVGNVDAAITSRGSAANLSSVKTKTDSLTFTTPNSVDASISQDAIDEIVDAVQAAAGNISPVNVDTDHTWKFDNPNQTTAPKIINELAGFNGLLCMDFTEPMPSRSAISSVTSATFTATAGTEPTVSSSAVTANKDGVNVMVDTTSATTGVTYTLNITVVTTDSQTYVRAGRLRVS